MGVRAEGGIHIDRQPAMGQLFWLDTGEHAQGGGPDRVDVTAGTGAALELLGRHIAKGTHHRAATGGSQLIAH